MHSTVVEVNLRDMTNTAFSKKMVAAMANCWQLNIQLDRPRIGSKTFRFRGKRTVYLPLDHLEVQWFKNLIV